jgi:hypothetical protein
VKFVFVPQIEIFVIDEQGLNGDTQLVILYLSEVATARVAQEKLVIKIEYVPFVVHVQVITDCNPQLSSPVANSAPPVPVEYNLK